MLACKGLHTSAQRSLQLISTTFADTSHLAYYATQTPLNVSRRRHSRATDVQCAAGKPGGRRARVLRQAAEVASVLNSLQSSGQTLASYQLRIPNQEVMDSLDSWGSMESSSSSESSESEGERAPQQRRQSMSPFQERRASGGQASTYHAVSAPTAVISVCQGKSCTKRGSGAVLAALRQSEPVVEGAIAVQGCKCLGHCKRGPTVHVSTSSGESAVYVGVNSTGSIRQIATAALHE